MPRRSRGPRLYLDPKRKQWVIRDGARFVRTGRAEGERGSAEALLGQYLAQKFRPNSSTSPLIAEMLLVYRRDHAPHTRSEDTIRLTCGNLERWWGDKTLADVTARNCRAYAGGRPRAAARRDLETLRAAIGYWHREHGPLASVPAVILPPKSSPRARWLSKSEAAKLLLAARRIPHLARFIIIGLRTGSRAGSILALEWDWIDLERGVMHRRAAGEIETNKRRPPVRLGSSILAFLRRWRVRDGDRIRYVVHYEGKPVRKLRRSWTSARIRAGLDPAVTPHTLRHSRATWMMHDGVDHWQAAGSLGMSLEMLTRTYGHHHPDWQKDAAEV